MNPLRRNTTAVLQSARAGLAELATAIAELARRREVALADADDIEAVHVIDREAHDQGLRLRALQDKIALLEHKLADEGREEDRKRYDAAVARIATVLPRRQKAAEQFEAALVNLAACAKEFCVSTTAIMEAWPPDTSWPERVYPGHCLSLERLGAFVMQVFQPPRGHTDKRPPTPAEFIIRACDADRHRGFAATEKQLQAEFISDLRTAHRFAVG